MPSISFGPGILLQDLDRAMDDQVTPMFPGGLVFDLGAGQHQSTRNRTAGLVLGSIYWGFNMDTHV